MSGCACFHLSSCVSFPREFFLRASTVDPPGKKLGIDEYSEVTRLTKPVIYISVKEICSTHSVS